MGVIAKIRALFAQERPRQLGRPQPLHEWYYVTFDEHAVHMRAEPPGNEPWSQSFRWDSVIRICFKAEGMLVSDEIYVFTSQRPESYVIPTEARGGVELWSEILRRKLFDANLAIEAASSHGGLYCWPISKLTDNARRSPG